VCVCVCVCVCFCVWDRAVTFMSNQGCFENNTVEAKVEVEVNFVSVQNWEHSWD